MSGFTTALWSHNRVIVGNAGNSASIPLGCGDPGAGGLVEADGVLKAGVAGTFSNIATFVYANLRISASTFKSRKNAADGSQSVSISASATGAFTDATHSDSIAQGDKFCSYWLNGTGNAANVTFGAFTALFAVASGSSAFFSNTAGTTQETAASTKGYVSILGTHAGIGSAVTSDTSLGILSKQRAAGSFSYGRVNVHANSRAAASSFGTHISGGSDGNIVISATGSTTGEFVDTTHSDAVTAGDKWLFYVLTGTGTGTLEFLHVSVTFAGTTSKTDMGAISSGSGSGPITGATSFTPVTGRIDSTSSWTSTEANVAIAAPQALSISFYRVVFTSNSSNANAISCHPSINGTAGAGGVSVATGTTGLFEDTTHSDAVASGNTLTASWSAKSAGTVAVSGVGLTVDSQTTVAVTANAAIGTIAMSAPAASANISEPATANAAIGTINVNPPHARALIDALDNDARVTQAFRLTAGDVGNIARATQVFRLTVGAAHPQARATQTARLVVADIQVDARVTQAARLVVADAVDCLTFWCQCWIITRRDGVVFRFTSLDEDFTWGADVYKSCRSLSASASQSATDIGNAGSVELAGIISDSTISEADIYGGRFDDAFVEIWLVAFKGTDVPKRIAAGWAGNLQHGEQGFTMDVMGPGARLSQQPLVKPITPSCRWKFGSKECGVNADALKLSGEVTSARGRGALTGTVSPNSNVVLSGASSGAVDVQWVNATLEWTSGVNAGQVCEVKQVKFETGTDDASIVLWALAEAVPIVGDTFDLKPGCDFLRDGGCTVYANIINFGGFPDVPGNDSLQQTPDA